MQESKQATKQKQGDLQKRGARIRPEPQDRDDFNQGKGACPKRAGRAGPDVPKAGRRGGGAPGQHDEAVHGSAEGKQRGKEARIRPESHDCHIFGEKAPPDAAKRRRGKPGCP